MMTAGPMLGLAALVATANAAGSGGSPPSFAVGENNVAGVMRNPKGNPPGVLLAGVFKAASGCESAAKANAGATSWTYHHCDFPIAASGNYSCHCYARTDSKWAPIAEGKIDSGFLRSNPPPPPSPPFKCGSGTDCQLNGQCDTASGMCKCDPAWRGDRCQYLDLLPASMDAGLQDPVLSSWGGSVLHNVTDNTWHMYAAVIEHGCGLAAWRPNSALGHATATSPDGPFTLQRLIKPHFAHEPVAIVLADGTILIYHIGAGTNDTGPGSDYAANCSHHCTGADHKWIGGGSFYGPTSILSSKNFDGPWETMDAGFGSQVPGCKICGDTNPAPVVTATGEVQMMWRTTGLQTCPGGSCMAWATALTWEGPYSWNDTRLFAGQASANTTHIEDAHMWIAPEGTANPGSYHAIFHSDVEKTSRGAAGGHAWSVDGKSWVFSAFNAFNNTVELTDGSTVTLRQRERPHLVVDGQSGRPVALTNGAGWLDDCDHVFTFAQPINTAPHRH